MTLGEKGIIQSSGGRSAVSGGSRHAEIVYREWNRKARAGPRILCPCVTCVSRRRFAGAAPH